MMLDDFQTTKRLIQIGHEEIMQRIAGKDKVLGGSTTQASSIQGPGIIQNHASLPSWIGEYDGGHSQRVKDLAEAREDADAYRRGLPQSRRT